MYPVSAAYQAAIQQSVRDVRITGTITLKDNSVINITDEDIVQGSLYVTEQCVAGEDIEVGNVYAAEMGLALTALLEDPYALDGARILLHFGINVGEDLWEDVPLGYFYVTEIERKLLNVKLTALDGMLLFDVPCGQPGPGTPAGFVAHACSIAGVTLANAAEVATFANASIGVGEPGKKVKTCRDLLMWACQLMGAFARMNCQGQLEIVPVTMRESVKTISKAERYKSDVSDFGVKITQIAMTVGETEYSRGTPGMTLAMEENPMMTGLDASVINTVLDNIRAQVTKAVYVPFNSSFIGDPALQPGDYITIKDAGILESETETYFYSENSPLEVQHNFVTSMITHSTWRYRGAHNIKAVGKSAMIRGVQQQQVKALSSVIALAKMAQSVALAANQSAQLINDAIGGHILIRQAPDETNEILIMDNPDPELATKIWRWNMGGLGYSDNCTGADNPAREYEIAMTMDGAINANFIRTGTIAAEHVQIGSQTTFEEGYDPSKTRAVGMGADAYCTGLWHFDGSLNSHKGVAAIFLGDFVASKWGQGLNIVKQPLGEDFEATEDTTAEFAAGTLVNVEAADDKLQLAVAPPVYGSDFTAGKIYTASSTYSGSYPASQAFDDSTSTYWRSASTGFPYWVDVDLGAAVTAIARKLRVYCELGLYMPENFILQGSNNASDWTDIYSGEIRFDEVWEEFEFSNSNAYRYYRLYCVDGPSAHVRINEIELMEIESEGYASLGFREQEYDISAVNIASDSVITWIANTPTNTSVAVQAAIAPDGVNYGSYQDCVSGQSIPGITPSMDVSKAKLKIKTILATTDSSVTPAVSSISIAINAAFGGVLKIPTEGHLHPEESSVNMRIYNLAASPNGAVLLDVVDDTGNQSLRCGIAGDGKLYIEDNAAHIAYGLNKSELVTWDNIVIQWKPERLSLIVNGEETAYVENPGQASDLGEYAYLGSDREEATRINTVIDELRIDRIYQPLEKVKAWYTIDAPFYTTEEFKQWPGYVQVETDGLKVYDSLGDLRVLVGSWVRDEIRKYGIKIIGGEFYAGYVKTAEEDATDYYVEIGQTSNRGYINFIGNAGNRSMRLETSGDQSVIRWYDEAGDQIARIYPNGTISKEMLFSSDTGITLSSWTGEKITMGPYQDKTAARGIQLTRVSADIIPYTDDVYYIGEPGRRWSDIYAHFVHTGDLCFEEKSCPICGGLFAPGEVLTLLVTAVDGSTYTIPIHDRCKGLPAEIEIIVPQFETQYKLNERGEVIPVRRVAMEEYEEEIVTLHPDYTFDENTGQFFRKDTEGNARMFGAEALGKGVEASARSALATDTVLKQRPLYKKVTVKMN